MRRVRVPSAFGAVAVVAALVLSGCLGQEAPKAAVSDAGAAGAKPTSSEVNVDPPAEASGKTGDLEVKVKDDLGTPFPGATVTVTPSTTNSTLEVPAAVSDASGVATFKGLPAQGYKVLAKSEGFEDAVQGATVLPGQLSKVELKLKYIIADATYNVTVEYAGRVACAAGSAVFASCQAEAVRAATNHVNAFRFPFGSAADPPVGDKLFEVWVEATWTEQYKQVVDLPDNPTGVKPVDDNVTNDVTVYVLPAPTQGRVLLFHPDDRNGKSTAADGRGDQQRPVRARMNAQELAGWMPLEGGLLAAEMEPTRTYATPGVIVGMEFKLYATVFYNGPADPCYSPALEKAIITQGCLDERADLGS